MRKVQIAAALAATLGFAMHGSTCTANAADKFGISEKQPPSGIAKTDLQKKEKKVKKGKKGSSATEEKGKKDSCAGKEGSCAGKEKGKKDSCAGKEGSCAGAEE